MTASQLLQLVDTCVDYGVACFLKGISLQLAVNDLPTPLAPAEIPAGFLAEIRVVSQRAIDAINHRVGLGWKARTYAASVGGQNGGRPDFEAGLMEQFPPLHLSESAPCVVVDKEGEVMLWYMPDMLLPERQAAIASTVHLAKSALNAHPPQPNHPGSTSKWRHSEYLYARNTDLAFGRGMTTLSPGWLCQAKEGYNDVLRASQDLAAPVGKRDNAAQKSAQCWLAANMETGILVSIALAIVHPSQYHETRKALGYLATMPEFATHMEIWSFAFNVVTLITNRQTPIHRDRASGGRNFYDLLLSIGGGTRTVLSLPGLGLRLQFDSGAVALFSGYDHLHEVSGFTEDRLCIACYARPPVIRWLNADHPLPPLGSLTLPDGWWQQLTETAGVSGLKPLNSDSTCRILHTGAC